MLLVTKIRKIVIVLHLVFFLVSTVCVAQGTPEMERVLLPVTVRGLPGAFGTTWTTDLWIRIDTDGQYVLIKPIFPVTPCDPPCPEPWGPLLAPYAYPIDFFRTHPGETVGSIIYVQRDLSEKVHLSLRLSNGRANAAPVQLPVVRERSFVSGTVHILGVPLQPSSRATLRVYGIDPALLGSVRVRAFSEDSASANTIVFESVVPLLVKQLFYSIGTDPIPLRPPVAEINLGEVIHGAFAGVRLEVTPIDPTMRIWALVSITDNQTQDVTLRTPN